MGASMGLLISWAEQGSRWRMEDGGEMGASMGLLISWAEQGRRWRMEGRGSINGTAHQLGRAG